MDSGGAVHGDKGCVAIPSAQLQPLQIVRTKRVFSGLRRECAAARTLDRIMRERALSNEELGRRLCVSETMVRKWRTGERSIGLDKLVELKRLGADIARAVADAILADCGEAA